MKDTVRNFIFPEYANKENLEIMAEFLYHHCHSVNNGPDIVNAW
eukprot:CAMPEP_0176353106 /NCGR_PEP_ID=MMETSP0126-20121128/11545_1 /TAXON_ID=141414 ORGANISM="Strombidinopsis acuminatum, Strain SPMC142" /NCGR_SAMPLE_ID=MMETSP0126 /ASSEMBLY_ACC=CAM_ASM_000229 /LENGTH=43 /DNA_ID= /DNA_START= /DNA_END= /DNA_ORIENTATION=